MDPDTSLAARHLAAIVESSDDAIVGKDLTGIVTSWNAGAERLFGYAAEEMVGMSITRIIPPDRLEEEPRILARLRRGERVDHFETVRRRKDGTLVHVSLTISPIRDGSGRIVGASKIARDITARRRAEDRQRALYAMLSRVNRAAALTEIYEAAIEAVIRCQDAQRAAILIGDGADVMRLVAWRGLSDAYRAAVEGHLPWPADDPNPQRLLVEDVLTSQIELRTRTAAASEGIRALAFVPVCYEERRIGGMVLCYDAPHRFAAADIEIVEAIAAQVAFAVARRRGAIELERLVRERTRSLERAIEQMEEFSYSVSHDLRSPVRAMRGYAEAILEECGERLGPEGLEYLRRIQRSGARMDQLIQDLLTYTRISSRRIELAPTPVDRLVREILQQYPEMGPDRADISVEGTLPRVVAHEPSLTQVVSNLLSNAVKFVPPGVRPQVKISAERRDQVVRIWFADNGLGIKPEHHSRVFGMFERVHLDRRYEGTGIGLAIVRKGVERMNGRVGVESDGQSGSRFWIELPAADAVALPGS